MRAHFRRKAHRARAVHLPGVHFPRRRVAKMSDQQAWDAVTRGAHHDDEMDAARDRPSSHDIDMAALTASTMSTVTATFATARGMIDSG